ncbi:MAG TPA: hypothetical protein VNA19_13875 [Pyrinomonadaceae bacterium]|jgi:hypothetical protein|nr:hypothetical protein [Pyrinomonadaceae bacterium]
MSVKEKFTPDEWKGLLKAPMLAAYAVAGAAPSKQDDFVREMAAVADGIIEGEQRASKDSLLGAVVADIVANAGDEQRGQTEKLSLDEVKGRALDTCRTVAASLETKVSAEEAYEYKRWVLVVAQKVAAAAKEGGLFGFGGEQISGNEITTINEIGEAINI